MFWTRLFEWRRRRGRRERQREPSAQELLRSALEELQEQRQDPRRPPGKQRHIDDFRELVVDGAQNVQLSQALLELTQDSHANRKQLLDEQERLVLRRRRSTSTDDATRREAEQAAKEMKQEMDEHGVRPREHYYSPSERLEVGEVDRTYVIQSKEKRPERRDRRR